MKMIPLNGKHGKGKFALVDDEDYEELMKHRWYLSTNGYAKRGKVIDGIYVEIRMHRVLTMCDKHLFVDHINHEPLDNRKSNLRKCTPSQNNMNCRSAVGSTSKFKGVSLKKGGSKFQSTIRYNKKSIYLGYFASELEAAKAYNAKAKELFGEFAYLNKI